MGRLGLHQNEIIKVPETVGNELDNVLAGHPGSYHSTFPREHSCGQPKGPMRTEDQLPTRAWAAPSQKGQSISVKLNIRSGGQEELPMTWEPNISYKIIYEASPQG